MSFRATSIAVLIALVELLSSACRKKHPVIAKASAPAATRLPAPPKAHGKEPGPGTKPPKQAAGDLRYEEAGIASWYGRPFHGRAAANGEIYDMEKLTAAHKTLPFGTWVHVTNLANNKTVDVRITDRVLSLPDASSICPMRPLRKSS